MSTLALKEKFNSLTLESENHWDYRGNNNSERDYVHDFCTYGIMLSRIGHPFDFANNH